MYEYLSGAAETGGVVGAEVGCVAGGCVSTGARVGIGASVFVGSGVLVAVGFRA